MKYRIFLTRAARRGLASLATEVLQRVDSAILALGDDPRPTGCKKLRGEENFWRIRVGDYRVIYQIFERELVIHVIEVGHRRQIYG